MDKGKIKLSSKKTNALSDFKLKAYPKKERTHIVEKEITPFVKKEKKQIVKQKRKKLVNSVINQVNEVFNPLELNGEIYKTEIAKMLLLLDNAVRDLLEQFLSWCVSHGVSGVLVEQVC